jgi:UbiD family decarboxylase
MYSNLREFIAEVETLGALRHVADADPHHELGGITEVAAGLPECPALLFDNIKGYPAGFRVFTNATTTPQRAALALGIDPTLRPLDALKAWMGKRQTLKTHKPVVVKDAAFFENSTRGGEVDLGKLPAPIWHSKDGGPYIGSGSIVVMRDPDGGWINASIYRVQVHTRNKVTVQFDHQGRHGAIIAKKYWDAGKPCPIAVVNGPDPALFIAGFEYLPAGQSEYDFAGAIKDAPIDVIAGPATGLPLPAAAEIIFEGELLLPSQETLPEGPFGEFTGYYAATKRPCPVMAVTAVHHRNDPILLGSPPMKPPRFHFGFVPRRQHLEPTGNGRRHRRDRRLAARVAAHDRGRAQAALCRSRQARRFDRSGQQLHGPPGRRGGRGCGPIKPQRRNVGGDNAVRALRADRHRARCLVVRARPAHPAGGKGARRDFAFEGDHRGLPPIPLDRQIPADLGALPRRGARDRGEVGQGVAGMTWAGGRNIHHAKPFSACMPATRPARSSDCCLNVVNPIKMNSRDKPSVEGWHSEWSEGDTSAKRAATSAWNSQLKEHDYETLDPYVDCRPGDVRNRCNGARGRSQRHISMRQLCRPGFETAPVYVTQNGWNLNVVDEAGDSSRAWVDWPGHIWVPNWNEGAIFSTDGVTIHFDRGRIWQRAVEVEPPPPPPRKRTKKKQARLPRG